jgi:hypothetical protein
MLEGESSLKDMAVLAVSFIAFQCPISLHLHQAEIAHLVWGVNEFRSISNRNARKIVEYAGAMINSVSL